MIYLDFQCPEAYASPDNAVMTRLFVKLLEDYLVRILCGVCVCVRRDGGEVGGTDYLVRIYFVVGGEGLLRPVCKADPSSVPELITQLEAWPNQATPGHVASNGNPGRTCA